MKVKIKILQGSECVVDVLPTESILELKHKVQDTMGIEVADQKLLLTGKTLADENNISFYPGIKDGTKLNLVVKKTVQNANDSTLVVSEMGLLRKEVTRVLKRFYTESEAESIANKMMKDLKHKVNHISYDDLERLATALIQDQENLR